MRRMDPDRIECELDGDTSGSPAGRRRSAVGPDRCVCETVETAGAVEAVETAVETEGRTVDTETGHRPRTRLVPTRPPGRSTRKAIGYLRDIHELSLQGYTLVAIREALAAVGVHVSKSTVQRERARMTGGQALQVRAEARSPPARASATPTRGATGQPSCPGVDPSCIPAAPDSRSGREVAEDFLRSHITNPLVRRKDPP
jgi:hypothetical protein